jgi:hypothetical protein
MREKMCVFSFHHPHRRREVKAVGDDGCRKLVVGQAGKEGVLVPRDQRWQRVAKVRQHARTRVAQARHVGARGQLMAQRHHNPTLHCPPAQRLAACIVMSRRKKKRKKRKKGRKMRNKTGRASVS